MQRAIAAPPEAIFAVLTDPRGHVTIDSSGMLMEASGDLVTKAGDTFVVHMDREALNDYPLGLYDVTVAIVTFEPFTTAVLVSKSARSLATPFDAIAPQFDVTVWAVYAPFLAANRDRLSLFVRVMRQATTYANAHFDDVAPIIASYTKIDLETVRHGLRAKMAADPVPGNLQPVIDVAARFGELSAPFPARDIIPNPGL